MSWITDCAVWGELLAPPSLDEAITALTPAGYWKLQETSGTAAADSSGNGRNGTYVNGPTLNATAGPDGFNYPTFDGTNDTMDVPDNNVWSINDSGTGLTVFAIFKTPGSPVGNKAICEKANPSAPFNIEWVFGFTAAGFSLALYTPGGVAIRSTTGALTWDSGWHVVAVAVPSVSANGNAYWNGADVTGTPGGGSGTYVNNNAPLRWAGVNTVLGRFAGTLAHLAVFPRELDGTEVASLMSAAAGEGWY